MTNPVLYGIPNCDTVKKTRKFLDKQNVAYQFHDFRKDGCDSALVKDWIKNGADTALVNRRSTTWKSLDEESKQEVVALLESIQANQTLSALKTKQIKWLSDLLSDNPTLIKRPVFSLDKATTPLIGFKEHDYLNAID